MRARGLIDASGWLVDVKSFDSAGQTYQDGRVSELGVRAEGLLAGPRGRELCARLAGVAEAELGDRRAQPSAAGIFGPQDPERPAFQPGRDDPLPALAVLAEVAEDVNYWGGWEPGPPDRPAVAARLRAAAAVLAESAGCRWWWSGIDRSAQRYVQWLAREDPPEFGTAARTMRRVEAEDDDRERQMRRYRRRPADSGPGGGWWSHPWPGVLSTTRRLGRLGAVLLAGQEDGHGDTTAAVWPVAVARTARAFEIDLPRAWQELVAAYPRTATASFRHDWAWTGWDGDWLLPRWAAVARDWDGVHLTVAGYLATAGRALPAGTARTLLAGWNPDETYWLTDAITPDGPARAWHNSDQTPVGWQERTASP